MKFYKHFLVATIIVALFVGFGQINADKKTDMKFYKDAHAMVDDLKPSCQIVTKNQLKKMLSAKENFYLIDIRTSKEYKTKHIDGCVHIPRGILEFKMIEKIKGKLKKDIKKDDKIVLYCKKGGRSVLSAYALMQLGYTDVSFLEGGWLKWSGKKAAKKPAKKSKKKTSKRRKVSREGC